MAFDASPARDAALSEAALDQLFITARTRNAWSDRAVPEALLHRLYDLTKFGPTAVNNTPARFIFLTTSEAKARLQPHLAEQNRAKSLQAPVNVIIGYDLDFPETLPTLFPHAPGAKDWFADPAAAEESAFRNSTLQGGYFLLAARALGLDVGPMSGFDPAGVKAEFFAGTNIVPNFITNLGYGTDENLFPRSPRLAFDEAAKIL